MRQAYLNAINEESCLKCWGKQTDCKCNQPNYYDPFFNIPVEDSLIEI